MKRSLPSTSGRISTLGGLALVGIVAVLVSISVTRVHAFALDENERDAANTVQLFARALAEERIAGRTLETFVRELGLERQLSDADYLAGGRILRRHGYLFALREEQPQTLALFPPAPGTVLAGASAPGEARTVVFAWPWAAPRTGERAFFASPGGELWLHANPAADWSGEERIPALSPPDGWQRR